MLNINNWKLCELCFAILHPKAEKYPYCGNYNICTNDLPVGTILAARYLVGRHTDHSSTYHAYDLMKNSRVLIEEFFPIFDARRNQGDKNVIFNDDPIDIPIIKEKMTVFCNEAKVFARLNSNPNTVSVYDLFFENNTYYAVTEYFSRKSLYHFHGITENEALYILKHAANGLLALHDLGYLHLNITPGNIVISDNGVVKLRAFSAHENVKTNRESMSSIFPNLRKMTFIPIEMNRKNRGPWTDIYSLGATVYDSLCPNTLESPTNRITIESLDFSGLTPSFADILKKMLEIYPKYRYHSIPELKKDLETLKIIPIAPKIQ